MTDAVLGIDVSKNTLDTSLLAGAKPRSRSFANSPDGWRKLIAWLTEHKIGQVHACLEATGRYSLGIALALHEAGHIVSLVNPAQIRDFARTKLGRNNRSMPRTSANTLSCSNLTPGRHHRRPCGGCANSRRSGPARSPA
jgi:transposase